MGRNVKYLAMRDAIAAYQNNEYLRATNPRYHPMEITNEVVKDALKEFRVGELTVLGGCEGHGKSALALQLALDLAEKFSDDKVEDGHKRCVIYFSLEMDATIIMDRARKQLGIDRADDFEGEAGHLPFVLVDTSTVTTDAIREVIDEVKTEFDPKMIVVDYIQILSDPAPNGEVAKYDDISKALKEIARRDKLHVLSLASLNRSGDNYLPNNQNLRGSQQIAFNADNTLFIHQPALSDHSVGSKWKNYGILKVDKQRSGKGGGRYFLKFNQLRLRFEEPTVNEEAELKAMFDQLPSRRFGA